MAPNELFIVNEFILLDVGTSAPSAKAALLAAGVIKTQLKLYKAIRDARLKAAAVKVPDVPTLTLGAATQPNPGLVIVKFDTCPFVPKTAVAVGQHPAGKARIAPAPAPPVNERVGGVE